MAKNLRVLKARSHSCLPFPDTRARKAIRAGGALDGAILNTADLHDLLTRLRSDLQDVEEVIQALERIAVARERLA